MISNGADTCVKLALMPLAMCLYDAIIADESCLVPKADHESASDEHVRVCCWHDYSFVSRVLLIEIRTDCTLEYGADEHSYKAESNTAFASEEICSITGCFLTQRGR